MDTIIMYSENIKTTHSHKLLCNVSDKIKSEKYFKKDNYYLDL